MVRTITRSPIRDASTSAPAGAAPPEAATVADDVVEHVAPNEAELDLLATDLAATAISAATEELAGTADVSADTEMGGDGRGDDIH